MSNQWWSWILTAVGLTGFILAGRKVWWCWYVNIFCQALWFTYAIVTKQYGFIAASLAYTVVFTQNATKWTKEHLKERRDAEFKCPTCRYYRTWSMRRQLFWTTRATLEVCPSCGRWFAKPKSKLELMPDCVCGHEQLVHIGLKGKCVFPKPEDDPVSPWLCDCQVYVPSKEIING